MIDPYQWQDGWAITSSTCPLNAGKRPIEARKRRLDLLREDKKYYKKKPDRFRSGLHF